MKEFKGTPGRWVANPKEQFHNGSKNTFEVNFGNYGECVAEVVHGIENTRLIAAAPDMLNALIKLIEYHNDKGDVNFYDMRLAEDAVYKALGE